MRTLLRVRPLPVLLAASVLLSGPASAQSRASAAGDDYPFEDHLVWLTVHHGLTSEAAARQLATAPDSPATLALLLEANRVRAALDVLHRIVERRPERIAAAFEAMQMHGHRFEDAGRGYPGVLRGIIARARARLRELPRNAAADAAWYLAYVDPGEPGVNVPRHEQLRAFAAEYAGTEAALRAELELLERGGAIDAHITALEAFARRHAGTVVGAHALYQAARHLASNTREPPGTDPTERTLRVAALARELQSGAYPDSNWVRWAPDLVFGVSATNARYAPENLPRVLGVAREFLARPFEWTPGNPLWSGAGNFIVRRLPEIFAAAGDDPIVRTGEFLDEVEKRAPDPAAFRYLRGLWYRQLADRATDTRMRDHWRDQAVTTFLALARGDAGPYPRKALATVASIAFTEKSCGVAVDHYREYLARFPRSEWAWVAGLRLGQCEQFMGNWARARQAYLAVAAPAGVPPPALVLGHAFAGRASEALDDFRSARVAYERAERAWIHHFADPGVGTYQFYTRLDEQQCGCDSRSKSDVSREWLRRRSAELQRSTSLAGGSLLERGRFRVSHGAWADAVAPLEEFIRTYPDSSSAADARELLVRARLELVLPQTGPGSTDDARRAALAALDAIATEPYGFSVFAAQVTRATLHAMIGSPARADELMSAALTRWHEYGAAKFAPRPASALQQDVMDIRDTAFRPHANWPRQQFADLRSSESPPPFFIAAPEIYVTLHDESRQRVEAAFRLAARPGALLLNDEQIAVLERILTQVCGTDRETARPIQKFWNRFFTMGPGHWGGWILQTFPIVFEISFADPGRTSAGARVRTGWAGHTELLAKDGREWKVKGTSNHWME